MTTRRNVIAIVDNPDMRDVIEDMLWQFGWHTETYSSAGAVLASDSTTAAECLLVDIQLGDSTGIDVAGILISLGHRFPIVFITGSLNEVFHAQAKKHGYIACLQKPFSSEELKTAIDVAAVVHSWTRPPRSVAIC